jgi:Arc/MetJ-type ribon-helix-helix transcriptional regulator
MDRRIRDRLHIAGASDEYIMSRMHEASIHKPTDEERCRGRSRRRFLAGPEDYIKESLAHLRAVARCLELEEPSLISIQHSIDMVILHWLKHDDVRVWRAPAEAVAVGLITTFFSEVLRFELIHLYDEDTAGRFSHRCPLETSPLSAAMKCSFAKELEQMGAFGDETELIREGVKLFEGLPDDIDFEAAVRVQARRGNPVAKAWQRKLAEEEAAERAARYPHF